MPYYAVTVTRNLKSNNYSRDRHAIDSFITLLKNRKDVNELSDVHFELSKQNHLLHTHFMLLAKRAPYMRLKAFQDCIKDNKLNVKIESLRKHADIQKWVSYCHKSDHRNIIDDYEASIRPPSVRII